MLYNILTRGDVGMTFTYDGADLSKTIKHIHIDNRECLVEYLDGSSIIFTCLDKEQLKKFKEIMIEQAKDRKNNINIKNIRFNEISGIAGICGSLLTIISSNNIKNKQILYLISFLLLMYSQKMRKTHSEMIKELKKYDLFLELADDLDTINNSRFLKCVEFEPISQIPFDIDTLDRYSYKDVKTIYKTYKKQKGVISSSI